MLEMALVSLADWLADLQTTAPCVSLSLSNQFWGDGGRSCFADGARILKQSTRCTDAYDDDERRWNDTRTERQSFWPSPSSLSLSLAPSFADKQMDV